jgi:hypothetical protein
MCANLSLDFTFAAIKMIGYSGACVARRVQFVLCTTKSQRGAAATETRIISGKDAKAAKVGK